jgi:hypothetical protein
MEMLVSMLVSAHGYRSVWNTGTGKFDNGIRSIASTCICFFSSIQLHTLVENIRLAATGLHHSRGNLGHIQVYNRQGILVELVEVADHHWAAARLPVGAKEEC